MSVSPTQTSPTQTSTAQSLPPVVQARRQLRLRLKPGGSATGYVDGAWWPRSLDLATELPALAEVLSVRLGSVRQIVYALASWDDAPRRIEFDGHPVRLEGFRSQDEDAISVVALDRRRIRLLVVPPSAEEQAGHDAMMAAGERDNIDSPATILTTAGIRSAGRP